MKKKQVLSALIAGTLAAMVFTGCGEDGKIPQDNNKDNSSNPVSDMVSDAVFFWQMTAPFPMGFPW